MKSKLLCFLYDYLVIVVVIVIAVFFNICIKSSTYDWWLLFLFCACFLLCPIKKGMTMVFSLQKKSKGYHIIVNSLFVAFSFYFTIFYNNHLSYYIRKGEKILRDKLLRDIIEIPKAISQEYPEMILFMALLAYGFYKSDLYCKKQLG